MQGALSLAGAGIIASALSAPAAKLIAPVIEKRIEARLDEAIQERRPQETTGEGLPLAELLDITPIHLKNMESSRRNPSVPLLFQMMELLDFSVEELVFPDRSVGHPPDGAAPVSQPPVQSEG